MLAQPVSASGPGPAPTDHDAEQILQTLSTELMSPYCPGRTISSCPSDQARKLEDHILAEAKAGMTREQIETELRARFGDEIVGYAPPPGMLWVALALGLVALVLIAITGRRWARRPAGAAGPQPEAPREKGVPGHETVGESSENGPTQAELDALEDALDEEQGF